MLEFLETSSFTRRITELLTDLEYAALQEKLLITPEAGSLIPGTAGLRKLRWVDPSRGKGKRGGVRVIYYWYDPRQVIYMLTVYSKEERDDLTARDKRILRQLVYEEFQ